MVEHLKVGFGFKLMVIYILLFSGVIKKLMKMLIVRLDLEMVLIATKLGLDTEDSFETLKPVDKSPNYDWTFPCSRSDELFEHTEVIIPKDLTCENCTFQFIWRSKGETQYYCADVLIYDDELNSCMNSCQNGGICTNGACRCPDKYEGDYCESLRTIKSNCYYY